MSSPSAAASSVIPGLFDFFVAGIVRVPAAGLRSLRALRLLSVVPRLERVVEAMLRALPGKGSIVLPMALLLSFVPFAWSPPSWCSTFSST